MAKHLRHSAFQNSAANISGLEWQVYSTVLEETDSFDDVFQPSFWRHHSAGTHTLNENDLVRVIAHDGSFDFLVTVREVIPGGLVVSFYTGRVPHAYHGMHADDIRDVFLKNEAEFDLVKLDNAGRPIPRVEQLATGWRVVGNDSEVVEHSIRSKSQAEHKFDRYLRDLKLRLPTPAESAQHKQAITDREAEQTKATQRKSPNKA